MTGRVDIVAFKIREHCAKVKIEDKLTKNYVFSGPMTSFLTF